MFQKAGAKRRRRRTKRGRAVKGAPSKTHSGQDYRTRKGSKYYNRRGHRQRYSQNHLRDTPFGKLLMAGSDRRKSRKSRRARRTRGFRGSRCFTF